MLNNTCALAGADKSSTRNAKTKIGWAALFIVDKEDEILDLLVQGVITAFEVFENEAQLPLGEIQIRAREVKPVRVVT